MFSRGQLPRLGGNVFGGNRLGVKKEERDYCQDSSCVNTKVSKTQKFHYEPQLLRRTIC